MSILEEQSAKPASQPGREDYFHTLVEAIPQQVWTATPDGQLDYVNRRVTDYFGLSYEAMIGSGWTTVVHPDDLPETISRWSRSLTTGQHYENNFRLLSADGSYHWHFAMASPLRDASGNIIKWIGTNTDISQHKAAEAALAISEAHLAAAQSRALIGSWELDLVKGTGSASSEWFELVGRDPSLPMPSLDEFIANIHPDDRQAFKAINDRLLAEKGETQMDFRFMLRDGSYRWLEARSNIIIDEQGNPIRMLGTTQDISERKEAEAALQISEENLAAAQARAKMGSWRQDLRTGRITWSHEMYRIFGLDPKGAPPTFQSFVRLVHPADKGRFLTHYEAFIREGSDYQIDFRVPQPGGSDLWIEARSETIRDASGTPIVRNGTAQDITDRKLAELAFNASESRFREFMEKSPALSFIKDDKGIFVYINPTFERTFQLRPEDVEGKTVFDFLPQDVAQRIHDYDVSIFASNQRTEGIEDVPTPQGVRHWLSVKFIFSNASGQRFLGCTAIDLTDHHNAEQALRTSTHLLNTSQAVAKLGGWEYDIASNTVFWTEQVYRLLDTTPEETQPTLDSGLNYFVPDSRTRLSNLLNQAASTGEAFDVELEMITLKGRRIDVRIVCSATLEKGKPVKLTGIIQDISEPKAAQRKLVEVNQELEHANTILEHIAHYDALTHLPNRVLLADRMQQAMHQSQRRGQSLAVAFLDLDGFKTINDLHGHGIGDQLLIQLAQRMRAAIREGDTLARIGGDEFVVVLTDLTHPMDCEPLLLRLLQASSEPVNVGDYRLEVSASIGVTIYPQDGVDAEQLLRHADQAMYLAKQAGKNCYHLFDVAKDVAVKHQRESLEHIRSALYNEEFVLYYQPKVNMRTGDVIGAEALIRWQHPERGLLPPGVFLPAVENHTLSIEMGEWVIKTALRQMAQWRDMGLNLPISVNIGALQLQHSDFADRLRHLLTGHPHPNHLELEILETSALEDIAQVSGVINACQALGVTFALDDFGTGYSSLAYLKRLPAELLKIDQSFVRDMLEDADDLAIIKGIIGLATAFRRQVIAEGVETIAHGEMLLRIGCELAQGYGIARPMPATAIPDWVKTWQPDIAWRTKSQ